MGCSNSKAAASGAYPIKLDAEEEQPRVSYASNKAVTTSYQQYESAAPIKAISDDDREVGYVDYAADGFEEREQPDTANVDDADNFNHFDVCFDDNDAPTEEETKDAEEEEELEEGEEEEGELEEEEEEEEEEEWIEPTTPHIDPETGVTVLNKEKDPLKWAYEVWSTNNNLLPWRPAIDKEESKLCMTVFAEIETSHEETETEDMTDFSADDKDTEAKPITEHEERPKKQQHNESKDSMRVSDRATWLKNEAFVKKSQSEKIASEESEKNTKVPESPNRQSVADRVAWLKTEVSFTQQQPQEQKKARPASPKKIVTSFEALTPVKKGEDSSHSTEEARQEEEEPAAMGVSERAAWLKNDAFGRSQTEKKVDLPVSPERQSVADRVAWLKTEVSFTQQSSPKKSPNFNYTNHSGEPRTSVRTPEKPTTLEIPPLGTKPDSERPELSEEEAII